MAVDLNIDLGELPGEPEELYALATVVNIACGGHAGDVASMRRSVALARRYGPRITVHPSYPDREQFGRARMAIPLESLFESIVEQVTALSMIADESGLSVWGSKLHGALYHAAAADPQLAAAVLDAMVTCFSNRLVIVGPPGGELETASRARGLRYAREGFADRSYDEHGHLVPRGAPGDVIVDPSACAEQAVRLARNGAVETICVHGDTANAVAIARGVRAALEQNALLSVEDSDPGREQPRDR
jgi:5-oxoprolinase (ATP-hydrolysing) subunit A